MTHKRFSKMVVLIGLLALTIAGISPGEHPSTVKAELLAPSAYNLSTRFVAAPFSEEVPPGEKGEGFFTKLFYVTLDPTSKVYWNGLPNMDTSEFFVDDAHTITITNSDGVERGKWYHDYSYGCSGKVYPLDGPYDITNYFGDVDTRQTFSVLVEFKDECGAYRGNSEHWLLYTVPYAETPIPIPPQPPTYYAVIPATDLNDSLVGDIVSARDMTGQDRWCDERLNVYPSQVFDHDTGHSYSTEVGTALDVRLPKGQYLVVSESLESCGRSGPLFTIVELTPYAQ